jgi:hypothetical protein
MTFWLKNQKSFLAESSFCQQLDKVFDSSSPFFYFSSSFRMEEILLVEPRVSD